MAIFGNLRSVQEQAPRNGPLPRALRFVQALIDGTHADLQTRARQLKPGGSFEVEIEGREIYAGFQAYPPKDRQGAKYEAHKEYTDIQLLLAGEETIEVCPLDNLAKSPAYDEKNNAFFPITQSAGACLPMRPGLIAVLFPSDAHAPCLACSEAKPLVIKVVVKVRNALAES